MHGKICLITGGNSGIGKAAACGLAHLGATVVIVCRTPEKGEAVAAEIREKTENRSVDFLAADLSSQASIRRVAADFQARYPALHVLINNAGIYSARRILTVDGIEMMFAVNHLAYFLLTHLLLDLLKPSAPSRIINVSSEAHRSARLNFGDLQGQNTYSGFGAYRLSKLCNLLFTQELAGRLHGTRVTVNALHPGVVATGIFRNTPAILRLLMKAFAMNPEKGAETMVYLASSTDMEGVSGKYFIKKTQVSPSSQAHDFRAAERLWRVSLKLTNLPPEKNSSATHN